MDGASKPTGRYARGGAQPGSRDKYWLRPHRFVRKYQRKYEDQSTHKGRGGEQRQSRSADFLSVHTIS